MPAIANFQFPDIGRKPQTTAHVYAYHRLRNALMVGALTPGTALKIRALAQYMDVSPTPIREALARLSSENAVQVLNNKRIIVPWLCEEEFEELIVLRTNLECLAAERALPYLSDILIGKLAKIDAEMDQAMQAQNYDRLMELNQKFHEQFYAANPHQTILPLIHSVWLQLGPFQRQVFGLVMDFYQVDRHKEILSALRMRNVHMLMTATKADIADGIGRAGRASFNNPEQQQTN